MKTICTKVCLVFLGIFFSATVVQATNFINPSFETRDFSGWTTQDLSRPFYPLKVISAGPEPAWMSFYPTIVPTDGNFVALTGFDGNGPGVITIGQQVTIDKQVISFDYQAGFDMESLWATQDRTFNVRIYDVKGGNELKSFTLLTAPAGTALSDTGIKNAEVDLFAFYGQSVFFAFEWVVPENMTGPASFWLDNILSAYGQFVEEGFGELYTSIPMVAFSLVESFQGSASDRMVHLRQSGHDAFAKVDPLDGLMLASAGDVTSLGAITGDVEKNKNSWAAVYGVKGDVDGDETIGGYDYTVAGVSFGFDFKTCQNSFLGIMAGISKADVDTDISDDADVTSWQLGVYNAYGNGPFYLDSVLTYASSDYETSRETIMGTAESDYDGEEWGAAVEFGYVMHDKNLVAQPFFGMRYIYVDQDSFDEKGAGNMNMSIKSRSDYSWKIYAGTEISKVIEQGEGKVLIPKLRFAFKHELGDDNDVVTTNFVNDPVESNLSFEGVDINRNSVELGVGLKMVQLNKVQMDLNFDTEFNGDQHAYAASMGLKYMW